MRDLIIQEKENMSMSGTSKSSEYKPPKDHHQKLEHETVDNDVAETFYAFAKLANEEKIRSLVSFDAMNSVIQQRKARAAARLMELAFEIMAPNHADDLKALTLSKIGGSWTSPSSMAFERLMANSLQTYQNSHTKIEKMCLLKFLAPSIPYAQLTKYLPDISHYRYKLERLQSKEVNLDLLKEKEPEIRETWKNSQEKIELFINFITRYSVF
jgi:hypothetical protein